MAFTVEILFDHASEKKISQVYKTLKQARLSPPIKKYRPSVTLGVCDDLSGSEEFIQKLQEFSQKWKVFSLELNTWRTFPCDGNVFIGIQIAPDLLDLHSLFNSFFLTYAIQPENHYYPGCWVPMCVLSYGLSSTEVEKAEKLLEKHSLPIEAKACYVAIFDQDQIVKKFSFSKK